MNDLFKKLNVLVKSTLRDALEPDARRNPLPGVKLGKGIDYEVKQLRERINDALSFEDQLRARVQLLQAEIAKWDQQADDSVTAGNDAHARYAIEQLQRAQQRLAIAESDLREHQLVTQELIMRVNTLDAAVADARRSEKEAQTNSEQHSEAPAGTVLSDKLREVREQISRETESLQVDTPQPPVDDEAVEDDLARRRQRLSRPE
jgi:phage shock protein A